MQRGGGGQRVQVAENSRHQDGRDLQHGHQWQGVDAQAGNGPEEL